jgi:hypothetical protein
MSGGKKVLTYLMEVPSEVGSEPVILRILISAHEIA